MLSWVNSGGASFERLVFTRNRRVMVSVGDGGATLRLNERFRDAPPSVLEAVGRLFRPLRTSARRRARGTVLDFLREHSPAPALPARRVPTEDRTHLAALQAEFDRVNQAHFSGSLPRVPLRLSGRMSRRNGHISLHPLEIVVSRRLCRDAVAGEAEKTLRHEMIHLWQHVQGRAPGHGPDFRRWAARLDVHPRATRDVVWK